MFCIEEQCVDESYCSHWDTIRPWLRGIGPYISIDELIRSWWGDEPGEQVVGSCCHDEWHTTNNKKTHGISWESRPAACQCFDNFLVNLFVVRWYISKVVHDTISMPKSSWFQDFWSVYKCPHHRVIQSESRRSLYCALAYHIIFLVISFHLPFNQTLKNEKKKGFIDVYC